MREKAGTKTAYVSCWRPFSLQARTNSINNFVRAESKFIRDQIAKTTPPRLLHHHHQRLTHTSTTAWSTVHNVSATLWWQLTSWPMNNRFNPAILLGVAFNPFGFLIFPISKCLSFSPSSLTDVESHLNQQLDFLAALVLKFREQSNAVDGLQKKKKGGEI